MNDVLHFLIQAEDAALREELARRLRAEDWQVWTPADVLPGDDAAEQHDLALRRAAVVVVEVSAKASDEARSDALAALAQRRRNPLCRVVPVGRRKVTSRIVGIRR